MATRNFSIGTVVVVVPWDGSWDECAYGSTMPPRARRRRGYVEQLPSGSWRAVVYARVDPLTKEDVRLRETSKVRAEADKALTALLRRVDERKAPKSGRSR